MRDAVQNRQWIGAHCPNIAPNIMKVFISWSGDHSRKVAELLKSWLEDVLQGVEAWMSKEDISKGEIWFSGLSDTLAKTDFGILCLTAKNSTAPWILFEAGALSKGLSKSRVCPLLIDFGASSLTPPLSQFNAALPTRDEMLKLVQAINRQGEQPLLTPEKLSKAFNRWWDEFESKFAAISKQQAEQPTPPQRSTDDMVVEILETVRALQKAGQQASILRRGTLADLALPEWTTGTEEKPVFTFHPNLSGGIDIYRSPTEMYLDALRKSEPEEYRKKPIPPVEKKKDPPKK
jgi:hypothetical protein